MPTFELALLLLCMAGGAFFSGMETGVVAINPMRLRHLTESGAPHAGVLQDFHHHPDRLLGTTLVGTNVCTVIASICAASLATRALGDWGKALSTAVMSALLLVFSEYIPKAWFQGRPLERCIPFAAALRAAARWLYPVARIIIWATDRLAPRSRTARAGRKPFVTRDELKMLAHEGERHGVLSPQERVMIHRVFELQNKFARQMMMPRSRMVTVPATATVMDFLRKAQAENHTRLPVYDRGLKRFVGVANIFDVLSEIPERAAAPIAQYMRPPLFIPEDMRTDDIFPRMRRWRQPMCLVKNRQDEVVGLITSEDVLEEIVGQL